MDRMETQCGRCREWLGTYRVMAPFEDATIIESIHLPNGMRTLRGRSNGRLPRLFFRIESGRRQNSDGSQTFVQKYRWGCTCGNRPVYGQRKLRRLMDNGEPVLL